MFWVIPILLKYFSNLKSLFILYFPFCKKYLNFRSMIYLDFYFYFGMWDKIDFIFLHGYLCGLLTFFKILSFLIILTSHYWNLCQNQWIIGNIPRSGNIGPKGSFILNFLKKLHTVFHNGCTILRIPKHQFGKNTCTPVFIVALFTIAMFWKQPKCPSVGEWIKSCDTCT